MISFVRAQRLIGKNVPKPKKIKVSLASSLGDVIAEDVKAPFPLPLYDNSAMDGYVLRSCDTRSASQSKPVFLKIKDTIKAGDYPKRPLRTGEAYKIMTGALIPKGGDCILPKEEALVKNGCLIIEKLIEMSQHVRRQGEEIEKGRRVICKGAVIHPATVGILASLGLKFVSVFARPKVSVIATGSELIPAGKGLKPGKIYDSNSLMVSSILKSMRIEPVWVRTIGDRKDILKRTLQRAFERSDLLILTGGVSVGDYDYVKEVLSKFGVRAIFWKVSQKPGKPLFFGRRRKKLVFGLPGNPASVFTCFYEYVFPALRRMSGFRNPYLHRKMMKIGAHIKPDQKKILFLKGKTGVDGKTKMVMPLGRQGSHMISSLQDANCFILVSPSRKTIERGQKVRVDLLPVANGAL